MFDHSFPGSDKGFSALQRVFYCSILMTCLVGATAAQDLDGSNESFVTIERVVGNQIFIANVGGVASSDAKGNQQMRGRRGRRGSASGTTARDGNSNAGGGGDGFARGGRFRMAANSAVTSRPTIIVVPKNTKITSAFRERRTRDLRLGAELAGGLRHEIFRTMQQPLPARIVSRQGRITEINVFSTSTDINQGTTDFDGQRIIAVRPKRPPKK